MKLTKWLKMISAGLTTLAIVVGAHAQSISRLSLEEANELARKNYPLIKQRDLISKTSQLSMANLLKGFLPQINITGQASYQSEVTQVKVPIPGFTIDPLSKDQYKLVADVNQVIYDGGVTREQRNIQHLNANVEHQKLEVELYKLRERINQVFLSVLYLDEQMKQVDLIKADINNGIKKVEAQVNNGTAFRSNVNLLQAELLKADQRAIEISASRKGLVQILSAFINQNLPPHIELQMPVVKEWSASATIGRPELQLFSSQEKLLMGQDRLIGAKNLPRASLFVQGGYGRPGLNFLKNEFDFFYVGGVRLNWSLSGLYTRKQDRAMIDINRQIISAQKETFLLNTNASLIQQQSEIDKLMQLLASDKEIIDLRVKVKDAAKAQLENGVITANDYLREVNAEDLARQVMIAHQLQLIQAQINYKTISGN